jgi:hypothetical protein
MIPHPWCPGVCHFCPATRMQTCGCIGCALLVCPTCRALRDLAPLADETLEAVCPDHAAPPLTVPRANQAPGVDGLREAA